MLVGWAKVNPFLRERIEHALNARVTSAYLRTRWFGRVIDVRVRYQRKRENGAVTHGTLEHTHTLLRRATDLDKQNAWLHVLEMAIEQEARHTTLKQPPRGAR